MMKCSAGVMLKSKEWKEHSLTPISSIFTLIQCRTKRYFAAHQNREVENSRKDAMSIKGQYIFP